MQKAIIRGAQKENKCVEEKHAEGDKRQSVWISAWPPVLQAPRSVVGEAGDKRQGLLPNQQRLSSRLKRENDAKAKKTKTKESKVACMATKTAKEEAKKTKHGARKQGGLLAIWAANGSPVTAATNPAAARSGVKDSRHKVRWLRHGQTTRTGSFIAKNRDQKCFKIENKPHGAKEGSTRNKSMQTYLKMGR